MLHFQSVSSSRNRFRMVENIGAETMGPRPSGPVPYRPKVAERGMALGMDLLMEIPEISLTIFHPNGHHGCQGMAF